MMTPDECLRNAWAALLRSDIAGRDRWCALARNIIAAEGRVENRGPRAIVKGTIIKLPDGSHRLTVPVRQ